MKSGEDLVALAATVSIILSEEADLDEIITFIEFFGLVRHNLEIIKFRRITAKIERKEIASEKKEEKKK